MSARSKARKRALDVLYAAELRGDVTGAAALFLGERVGWRRWTAIAIGFLGVLIVVRPGLAWFDAYSLLALVAVAAVAVRDLPSQRRRIV